MVRQVFTGPIIHVDDSDLHKLVIEHKVTIIVEDGKITSVTKNADQQMIDDLHADEVHNLKQSQFMMPGFIDCHTYATQFPNLGLGYDKRLLDWQEAYTYPLERVFIDVDFSEKVFDKVIKRTMFCGTTTACYSASLYSEISTVLAKKCAELGQRAFVGKINMNARRDDGYYETMTKSINTTKRFIETVEEIGNPLVQPIITPRSALTCDMELLQKLGRIAAEKDLLIQSNVSQDPDEVNAVKRKFGLPTYTDVYKNAGLLNLKTILAHGTCLENSEVRTLADKKIPIVHCPTSNFNLRSGVCNVPRLQDGNVKVCLGTDIAGGSNYNILNEMRLALQVSHSLHINKIHLPLEYPDVFSMATLGGAKALRIDNKVGNFKPGKDFDALIIDMKRGQMFVDVFKELDENLQRFLYCGTSDNILSVFIKGRQVK